MQKTVTEFHPEDTLRSLLRDFRLESSVLCRSLMAPPWGFAVAERDLASFHMVVSGEGWLDVDGAGEPIPLSVGDLAILPRGHAHRVRDSLDTTAPLLTTILATQPVVDGELYFGGNGAPTAEIVCGVFTLESVTARTWLGRLPPVVLSHGDGGTGTWRSEVGAALRAEAKDPTAGGAAVINRLLESLLVDAIGSTGTRSANEAGVGPHLVEDRRIARALAATHEHPEAAWTVARLAQEATMSRSSFSARFHTVVGEAPMRYLTEIRLARAARLLRSTDATLAEIAGLTGYRSEEALGRAFKVRFGEPPGVFRRAGSQDGRRSD